MHFVRAGWLALVLVVAGCATASAQGQSQQRAVAASRVAHSATTERANQNTVTVISGNPNGSYLFLAYDMSAVLDDGEDGLRVLPVIGKGGYQNVKDILHLKGVDLGITQSNIMSYLKASGEFGANIDSRLSYVAKLYNEEMHILAGAGIETLADLNGKTCNYSDIGSGTQFSTRLVFELLGIKCGEVNLGQSDGYLKVKTGEIAATVLIAGKPSGAFAKFKLEPGMKLLSLPYAKPLETDYFPTTLTHKDYPNLIGEGKSVETIAVGAVLAVYNWPQDSERYRRVSKFIDAFFGKFDQFLKAPRHPKWQETNLAAPLKGWKRFPAAQELLDRSNPQGGAPAAGGGAPATTQVTTQASARPAPPASATVAAGKPAPANASADSTGDANQEVLFRQFLDWNRQQSKR
jgi:uncharacterized protein